MPLYGSPLWCSGKHAPDALPRGSVARRSDDQSRGPRRADRALSRNSSADRQGIAQRCPKRICFGTASPVIFTPAPPERPTGICQDVQRLVSCPGTGGGWLPWSGRCGEAGGLRRRDNSVRQRRRRPTRDRPTSLPSGLRSPSAEAEIQVRQRPSFSK